VRDFPLEQKVGPLCSDSHSKEVLQQRSLTAKKSHSKKTHTAKKEASHSKIKGPDNPTRQLLPIMSAKGCSRDGEGRKGKGGGEGSKS